ncbi:CO dehydrogenase maturation factor [Halalkaliarchaeum desulfuricum]|uniref:CO dehydrogenase maturation factor n=1 Tax=Halalkaliarchaeum desulfuricum TaxID=2055893 RepID=A0A343THF0_9EURY|nr:ArsA-related P-loop ATPase [Halalkaliarchaeum desulfuricum]AUX08522.1 CO dehydrogenase maturation factor [Halalkaliarchaeum desulfuricum]
MCEECGCHDGAGHAHGHPHGHDHDHDHDHDHADVETESAVDAPLRIAVTGKGGVGKTTLSAALSTRLASADDVVAVDADPDMNLAATIGCAEPPPVTEKRDLIEDRAGGDGLVRLSPDVEDVLESHSTRFGDGDRGRLLTIGAPEGANTGCMCAENSFVQSLVRSALDADCAVLDMEAGIEHLGRGTAGDVDAMIVVVGPSQSAVETAEGIRELATEMGVEDVYAVVNRVRGEEGETVREALALPVLETVPYDEDVAAAALSGRPPVEASDRLNVAAERILRGIERRIDGESSPSARPVEGDD